MRVGPENTKNRIESRYLAQALELEETDPPRVLTTAAFAASGFVFLFLFWTGVTVVDQVEPTQGEVLPEEAVHAVQHLEGGIVQELNIREGNSVKTGDLLLKLLPTDAHSELNQLRVRRANLLLAAERHRAIAHSKKPEFENLVAGYDSLKSEHLALYGTQVENNKSQVRVLVAQLEQQLADLRRLTNRLASLETDIEIVERELKTREELYEKGLTTRLALLDIQRQHAQSANEINETRDSIAQTEKAVAEANGRITEYEKRTSTSALEEVSRIVGELAEVDETVKRAIGRADRLEIRAPVNGMVQGMAVKAVNAVVQPGQTLMEIVPLGGEIVVESEVPPNIIGHVKVNQDVEIRVASFDFATFGSINGSVQRISAATFTKEDGDRYYSAIIQLNKNFVGDNPELNVVIPGMSVQANIKTGSKSILDYLLKPVYRGFERSFGGD